MKGILDENQVSRSTLHQQETKSSSQTLQGLLKYKSNPFMQKAYWTRTKSRGQPFKDYPNTKAPLHEGHTEQELSLVVNLSRTAQIQEY